MLPAWLTPVVYSELMFANPSHWLIARALHLNPAYYYVLGFHQSLWKGQWVEPQTWFVCIAITLGFNLLGAIVLRRLRAEIRDVL